MVTHAIRGAVQYKGEWLAPNSEAFKLLEEKKFERLDLHMKEVLWKYNNTKAKNVAV